MDLAQKANRAKRDLQAAAHKPEATTVRHAIESFDAFADGIVEEIAKLKAQLKTGTTEAEEMTARPSDPVDVAPTAADEAERATATP